MARPRDFATFASETVMITANVTEPDNCPARYVFWSQKREHSDRKSARRRSVGGLKKFCRERVACNHVPRFE